MPRSKQEYAIIGVYVMLCSVASLFVMGGFLIVEHAFIPGAFEFTLACAAIPLSKWIDGITYLLLAIVCPLLEGALFLAIAIAMLFRDKKRNIKKGAIAHMLISTVWIVSYAHWLPGFLASENAEKIVKGTIQFYGISLKAAMWIMFMGILMAITAVFLAAVLSFAEEKTRKVWKFLFH